MSEQHYPFDELTLYEGADLEYKAARGGLPRDLWETYSAFANTNGGTLWLGVSQRDDRLDLHGVPDPERLVGNFWNTVNNRGKVSVNLLCEADVQVLTPHSPERRLIRINVPRATRRQRPVFLGSDPFRGTYRRNFEGDYLCNEAEVRRMFADQAEEPADSRILEGFSLDDLHPESLRQFRNLFAARVQHVWQGENDQGLLEKLGGWRRDRVSGQTGLTLAGLLMFGREQALRDPAAVPGFHLDYRERFSDDPAVRWTDRLTLDGTWEGNLFQFYQRVMLKLSSGPGIKRPFQVNAGGYRVAETPVIEALQEALVNALIHADYFGQGGIVIDRWLDRVEFSNPGCLLISRDQLLRGGVSECRNKSLQAMFQMLGSGDKAGSGIDKIRAGWASQHWQAPSLQETLRPDRVRLVLPMVSMLPEETLENLRRLFGDAFDTLESDEVQTLVAAHLEGEVTNQRMQDILALHRVDITRMLQGLVTRRFLSSSGVGRGTRYHLLSGEGTPPLSTVAPPLSTVAPPLSAKAPPLIHADEALWQIAVPVRERQRVKPELMRQTILALCQDEFLSLQTLGILLGRGNLKRLRDGHLSPMVRSGLLRMRFPKTPNHPEQGYRTNENTVGEVKA